MKAELIDMMGDDLTVVNAARVSFHKESEWETPEDLVPDRTLSERDQKLIKYLAKHDHWTPFSHVMVTMREKVPIFVSRQRFKHMVGFTYNEVSRRYVKDSPSFFYPEAWRGAPENAKQGSSDKVLTEAQFGQETFNLGELYREYIEEAADMYDLFIKVGVAPEQARMLLPQSMYTEYYVTGSLAAWARAYKLRISEDSQKEIQELARQWGEIIGGIPKIEHSWKALTDG